MIVDFIISIIKDYVIAYIDINYLICFMLISYIVLDINTNSICSKRRIKVLIVGIINAIAFMIAKYYGFYKPDINIKEYIFMLFYSFIFGQFINKYGIEVIYKKARDITRDIIQAIKNNT